MNDIIKERRMKCSLSAAVVLATLALSSAASADSSVLIGKWRGSYSCLQGHTGLELTFAEEDGSAVSGEFYFFALDDNPSVPDGRFAISGSYIAKSRSVMVKGVRWIEQPTNYRMVDLTGTLSEDGKHIDGKVKFEGCTSFHVLREGAARPTKKAKGS